MNNSLIYHIAGECVVAIIMISWFQYQNSKMSSRISFLEDRLQEMEKNYDYILSELRNMKKSHTGMIQNVLDNAYAQFEQQKYSHPPQPSPNNLPNVLPNNNKNNKQPSPNVLPNNNNKPSPNNEQQKQNNNDGISPSQKQTETFQQINTQPQMFTLFSVNPISNINSELTIQELPEEEENNNLDKDLDALLSEEIGELQ